MLRNGLQKKKHPDFCLVLLLVEGTPNEEPSSAFCDWSDLFIFVQKNLETHVHEEISESSWELFILKKKLCQASKGFGT